MAAIDIVQIILGLEKRQIPESYKDTLKIFAFFELKFPGETVEELSKFASFLEEYYRQRIFRYQMEKNQNFYSKGREIIFNLLKKQRKW